MNNLLNAILEIWLPSKWPRLIATGTIFLETGILTLSVWVPKVGLNLTEQEMSTIRIVGTPWLFVFSLFLIHHLVVYGYRKNQASKYLTEKRALFKAALKIIKRRAVIRQEQKDDFKSIFEEKKYFIKPSQEEVLKQLINNLDDVWIFNKETEPRSAITQEQRKEYIQKRRVILGRIENIEITVEKYLRETI